MLIIVYFERWLKDGFVDVFFEEFVDVLEKRFVNRFVVWVVDDFVVRNFDV